MAFFIVSLATSPARCGLCIGGRLVLYEEYALGRTNGADRICGAGGANRTAHGLSGESKAQGLVARVATSFEARVNLRPA